MEIFYSQGCKKSFLQIMMCIQFRNSLNGILWANKLCRDLHNAVPMWGNCNYENFNRLGPTYFAKNFN